MQKLLKLKNKKGFTLIEMLVVILIIVILITIAVPAVAGYRRDAQETADSGAAKTVFTALEAAATKISPGTMTGAVTTTANNSTSKTYLDIDVLEADAANATNPDEYAEAVLAFLGANFKGEFRFGFNNSTGSINWVAFRREGATGTDSTMLYHALDGYTGYLSDNGTANTLPAAIATFTIGDPPATP